MPCSHPINMQLNRIFSNSWSTIVWSIPRYCNRSPSGILKRECQCRRNSRFLTRNFIAPFALSNDIDSFYLKIVPQWMRQPWSSEISFASGSNLLPSLTLTILLMNRVVSNRWATIVIWRCPRQLNWRNGLTLKLEICWGTRDSGPFGLFWQPSKSASWRFYVAISLQTCNFLRCYFWWW